MDIDKAKEIEARIAELKRRWPAHSVPPHMWDELEELEAELESARAPDSRAEGTDGREDCTRRLP